MAKRFLALTRATFFVLGPVAIVLGTIDLTNSSAPFGWRVMALFVAGTGVAWLVTAIRVPNPTEFRSSRARTLFIMSNFLGLVLAIVMIASTIAALRHVLFLLWPTAWETYVFLFALAWLLVVCAVNVVVHAKSLPRLFRPVTGVLTAFGVTSWAIFQFWYTNQYAATNLGTFLNMTSELARADVDESRLTPLLATVKITNPGAAKAAIIASELVVTGLEMSESDPLRTTLEEEQVAILESGSAAAAFNRSAVETGWHLLHRSKLLAETTTLEPKEEYVIQRTVYVDESDYEAVRLIASVIAADGRRFILGTEPRPYPKQGLDLSPVKRHDVVTLWPLVEPSHLRGLVTGRPEILTHYPIGDATYGVGASLYWGSELLEESQRASDARRELLATETASELPLTGLPRPSSSPSPANGGAGQK